MDTYTNLMAGCAMLCNAVPMFRCTVLFYVVPCYTLVLFIILLDPIRSYYTLLYPYYTLVIRSLALLWEYMHANCQLMIEYHHVG